MLNVNDKLLDELNEKEYFLLSIIARFGRSAYPKNETLVSKTGWSLKTVQNTKKSLRQKGHLAQVSRYKESNIYICAPNTIKFFGGKTRQNEEIDKLKSKLSEAMEEIERLKSKATTEQHEETDTKKHKDSDIYKKYVEVFNYFVETTGKKRMKLEETPALDKKTAKYKFVTARIKEGATVELCKKVIKMKFEQWNKNEKSKHWIRFQTLFNKTKFEAYKDEVENSDELIVDDYKLPDVAQSMNNKDRKNWFFTRCMLYVSTLKKSGKIDSQQFKKYKTESQKDPEKTCIKLEDKYNFLNKL